MDSTAKIRMAISASFSFIKPNSPIGFAEGFAFFGIFCRGRENVFRAADARSAQREAAGVQNVERDDVAAADFVQEIFFRHFAIFHEDRAWWSCRESPSCVLHCPP